MESIPVRGIQIPRLGFGTFRMPGNDCQPVVESALEAGYRHIDTASMYQNEDAVGAALAASGLPRSELFLTTKVWHDQLTPEGIRQSLLRSLANLKVDQVDLFMIHWPSADMDMASVMETMVSLQQQGLTRGVGVCNFTLSMLRESIDALQAPIAAVQVEYHPFLDQSKILGFLRERGIPLTAYAPLAQGRAAADPALAAIGAKYGASAAQVAVAWLLDQPGVVAIPKARRIESQLANLASTNVRLDDADRAVIAALPKDQRHVRPPFSPAWDD